MVLIYKWRIATNTHAYLVDLDDNEPFISTQPLGIGIESEISKKVYSNFASEDAYKTQFEKLRELVKNDYNVELLDYEYYYNLDDTSCGLPLNYNYIQGKDGNGIKEVKAERTSYGTLVSIITDRAPEQPIQFTVYNGKNGRDGVSGINGTNGTPASANTYIYELDQAQQEIDNKAVEIMDWLKDELNNRLKNYDDDANDFANQLSALSGSVGDVIAVYDKTKGQTDNIWNYINVSGATKTQFDEFRSAFSGLTKDFGERINLCESSITAYERTIDLAQKRLDESMDFYDMYTGKLNSYIRSYDAVNNRLDNVISEMTGNSSLTFSDIYQTANEVGMILGGRSDGFSSSALTAGIVAKINESGSEISISADKINLLGETCARQLNAIDLTVNNDMAHFGSDGAGYLAGGAIKWDKRGNLTIDGDLGIGSAIDDAIENLGENDITFGDNGGANSTSKFYKSGAGYLAGGAIKWDETGKLRITNDVTIEGALSIGEIRNQLGDDVTTFGSDSAAATIFRPDGSGQLAGGSINWSSDGSLSILGDLHLGGSLIQEFIDNMSDKDIVLGGGGDTGTEFSGNGSGSLAGGLIRWDNKGSMTIEGNVTIKGSDDNLLAALNVKDISIGSGTTMFYANGSGFLANKNISWDTDGCFNFGNGAIVLDHDTKQLRINSTIQQSTNYTGTLTGANVFFLPSLTIANNNNDPIKRYSLTQDIKKDPGKIVTFYNNSPFKTGVTYSIYCPKFGNGFYAEDGYSALIRPQEAMTVTCFQTSADAYEWQLTNVMSQELFKDLDKPQSVVGRYPRMLALGTINGYGTATIKAQTWDGKTGFSVKKNGYKHGGDYVVTWDNDVKNSICPNGQDTDYIPFITVYNSSNATASWQGSVTLRNTAGFCVYAGDDTTPNDCNIFFMLLTPHNWAYGYGS